MDKDEMIKDMETAIGKALGLTYDGERLPFSFHTRNYLAKELVKAGYRKIADNEMVFTAHELCNEFRKHRQETAREILQELYDEAMRYTSEVVELTAYQIKQLAKEKGIELGEEK